MEKSITNIKKILDDGSFIELFFEQDETIHTGYGTINDKLVYVIAEENAMIKLSSVEKIKKIYKMAISMGAPILYIIDNNGVSLENNYIIYSLYGEIIKLQSIAHGKVSQIAIISGKCNGGMATIANNCDFVFVDENNASMWTIPPVTIEDNIDNRSGESKSLKETMLIDGFYADNILYNKIREFMNFIPSNYKDKEVYEKCKDDLNRKINVDFENIPMFIQEIADEKKYFEVKKDYAKSTFTGFIKLNNQTVGVVANIGKDKNISKNDIKKIIKFISFLDNFSIPLLTITNIEKFNIENNLGQDISIYTSELTMAYVNTDIPKVTIIKNAIGFSGFIMGQKSLNVDIVYGYDNSTILPMNEKTFAELIYNDDLKNSKDKLKTLNEKINLIKNDYNIKNYVKNGIIDKIINIESTRQMLISSFEMLYTKKNKKVKKNMELFNE